MLRFFLLTLFMLIILGCNSERADLRRIAPVKPLMFQFGQWSRLTPDANQLDETCDNLLYSQRDESYYCAGSTLSYVGEEHGGNPDTVTDALLIKFDRLFRVVWVRQLGLQSQGSHSDFGAYRSLAEAPDGSIYASLKTGGFNKIFKYSPDGILRDEVETKICQKLKVSGDRLICGGRNGNDAYVAKYFFDLRLDWEKTLTNSDTLPNVTVNDNSGAEQCIGLSISSSGKIACVGETASSLVLGFSPDAIKRDGFLWLLDSSGNSTLLKQIGSDGYDEIIKDVVFDRNENIILSGNYIGSDGSWIIPEVITRTKENGFLYRLNLVGSSYIPDSSVHHTTDNHLIEVKSMTLTPQGKLALCGETDKFISIKENNADAANVRDVFLYLFDAGSWVFEKGIQFGHKRKGRFDNLGNQYCNSVTHDQFGNFILGGETQSSTHEPNAGGNSGTKDIMIWRVGPNLEF